MLHHGMHFPGVIKDLEMGTVWVSPQCPHCLRGSIVFARFSLLTELSSWQTAPDKALTFSFNSAHPAEGSCVWAKHWNDQHGHHGQGYTWKCDSYTSYLGRVAVAEHDRWLSLGLLEGMCQTQWVLGGRSPGPEVAALIDALGFVSL